MPVELTPFVCMGDVQNYKCTTLHHLHTRMLTIEATTFVNINLVKRKWGCNTRANTNKCTDRR